MEIRYRRLIDCGRYNDYGVIEKDEFDSRKEDTDDSTRKDSITA